jgi:hypothetical protein
MADRSDGWPRLGDSIVGALLDHEKLLFRQHEEETIAASKLQLADICNNCHRCSQFAKTYRVLRRDLRETLEKARANLAKPSQQFSDVYGASLLNSTDAIVRHKLALMARHFYFRWGEPIENWAGKEGSALDRAGCSVLLLVAGACLGSVVSILSVLLFE